MIISAAMGAGHDGVAYELERRLHARGADAKVFDYLEMLPGRMGPFYRGFYQQQLKHAPASYEWLYGKMDQGVISPIAQWLGQMGKRKVRKLARDYDVVISTYPLGCQATGALRKAGKLPIPAVGFLTDVDVHALWLHKGLDKNFTVWHGSAVESINRVGVHAEAVGPVLPDTFLEPATADERSTGRELLGLTDDQHLVLLVGGSWGVGNIGDTARAIRDAGVGVPVVLCGRNEDLLKELDNEAGIIGLGWTKEVRRLLAASDVMIHNAGGLSCLEGFAIGVPVIGYACLPGHGHRNSLAMKNAGVAADATSEDELIGEIRRLSRTDEGAAMVARARGMFLTDPTEELLELAQAPVVVPQRPAARTWATRVGAVAAGVPLSITAVSFGVAQASEHGVGVANSKRAVYVAALVDHDQVADAKVVNALRSYSTTVAVRHSGNAPTATDVQALVSEGISVVGADTGVRSRNPRTLQKSMNNAAQAVSYAPGERPRVVCLKAPGIVEWTVARDHKVRLALSKVIVRDGVLPADVKLGDVVILDERGRTSTQVEQDLKALTALTTGRALPQRPLADVFTDES
ncbi:MAG: monogalactosyldiacylglycerol synthase [Frankiales bacterium]|nr:monogalactosyldiacylglycerol synthase [Frankiales bacterium]